MSPRSDALKQIQALVQQFGFSSEELLSCLSNNPSVSEAENGGWLQRILIYIGGAFIFMGVCVYIGMTWDDIAPIGRVILTLGSGFVAFILGLFCLGDSRYIRASTPLFLMASALEPTGLFVFMDEYLPKSGDILFAATFVFGFMTLQQAVAFVSTQRTSLLFFSLFFFYAFLVTLMNFIEMDAPLSPLIIGLTGLMVSWGIAKTEHRVICSFFYFWSSVFTAAASYDYLENTSADVLLIGVSAGLIYLSVIAASRTVLTVGVISLLAFLGYFTDEYFKDIVGWPIAMIVMGFLMIGISVFAVKLGKNIAKHDV